MSKCFPNYSINLPTHYQIWVPLVSTLAQIRLLSSEVAAVPGWNVLFMVIAMEHFLYYKVLTGAKICLTLVSDSVIKENWCKAGKVTNLG